MLGHADYRGPLKGLYHCGSGAHPGGGVTGAPGHNAARVILGDHRALFGRRGAGPDAGARFQPRLSMFIDPDSSGSRRQSALAELQR